MAHAHKNLEYHQNLFCNYQKVFMCTRELGFSPLMYFKGLCKTVVAGATIFIDFLSAYTSENMLYSEKWICSMN